MTRLLFVGEGGNPAEETLGGRCGTRLASLLGLTLAAFLAQHDRHNVLPFRPMRRGSRVKGDAFPMPAARILADDLRHLFRDRRAVLLGHRVAGAFHVGRTPYLTAVELHGGAALVLPHPSSVVRWWNDPKNVRTASDVLVLFATDADPLQRHR